MRIRLSTNKQLLLGIGIILTQVLLYLTFSWIAIPSWQDSLANFQIGLWIFHCVLLLYLIYSVIRTLAKFCSVRQRHNRPKRVRSVLYVGIIVLELLVICILSFYLTGILVLRQIDLGFYCSKSYEEIKLNASSKTAYIMHSECLDGLLSGGIAYIQESRFPVMKPIFEASKGRIKLSQSSIYVKLASQYQDSSKSIFYNVKTGELSDIPPY